MTTIPIDSGARVFVVQEQFIRDGNELRPRLDLSPAKDYGELHSLFQGQSIPRSPLAVIRQLHEGLANYGPGDYILPVGAPELIGWAIAIAAHRNAGTVSLLVWNRAERRYVPKTAQLWD